MKPSPNPEPFGSELMNQDPALSAAVLQEQRRRLTTALEHAERQARVMYRATVTACAVLVGAILAEVLIVGLTDRYEMGSHWSRSVGAGVVFAALVTAGTLLSLYNDRYRAAVGRQQSALQLAILQDLQQQVSDLQRQQRQGLAGPGR